MELESRAKVSEVILRGTPRTAERLLGRLLGSEAPPWETIRHGIEAWLRRCGNLLALNRIDDFFRWGFRAGSLLQRLELNETAAEKQGGQSWFWLGQMATMSKLAKMAHANRLPEVLCKHLNNPVPWWERILAFLYQEGEAKSFGDIKAFLENDESFQQAKKKGVSHNQTINHNPLASKLKSLVAAGLLEQLGERKPYLLTPQGKLFAETLSENPELQLSEQELETLLQIDSGSYREQIAQKTRHKNNNKIAFFEDQKKSNTWAA